jgi:hypothetical protein
MDVRTLLASALGVGLGLLLVAAPGVVLRAHTVGRAPHDRGGDYGEDGAPPARLRRLVQAVGVAVALFGLYLGVDAVATLPL